jgi:kynurenine 3-monooxygenase
VSRSRLNGILLDAAESLDAIEIFFEHKLVQCRIDRGELEFERNTPEGKETIKRHVDFIIGADGAHSAVRRELMRRTR